MKFYATAQNISKSFIGSCHSVSTPFGTKPMVYADSTASGRSLSFIESYIQKSVLPTYANTHTESSATGRQTTSFREEARNFIHTALNAPKSDYAVVFTGSGCTGAITKLASVLGISPFASAEESSDNRPVVFITHYEHHSNELIWRESNVDLVVIQEDVETGGLDLAHLEEVLIMYSHRPLKLGSFSAASNVTGIRSNVRATTELLHHYGALSVWDFAAAGPHTDMNLKDANVDGIYLSVHKFAGGPGTPGLLVAKRSLFQNEVPVVPGGGTVEFVTIQNQHYVDEIEHREEGGTPAIVESIRAGLVLQLHCQVGPDLIARREAAYLKQALHAWKKNPRIEVLGTNPKAERVSIVSFMIKSPDGTTHLHYNFVVALLNDLFGIQSRGGCACAGPLSHRLLGISDSRAAAYASAVKNSGNGIKPGWVRVNFAYYMTSETVDYIIKAIDLVATEGFKLLPWYKYDSRNGTWSYVGFQVPTQRLWNFSGDFTTGKVLRTKDLNGCFKKARHMLSALDWDQAPYNPTHLPESAEALRWFCVHEDIPQPRRAEKSHARRTLWSWPQRKHNGEKNDDLTQCEEMPTEAANIMYFSSNGLELNEHGMTTLVEC